MIPPDKLRALLSDHPPQAYVVIREEELKPGPFPPMYLRFGPGRTTIKWRGKRFNVPLARVIGVEFGEPDTDTLPATQS